MTKKVTREEKAANKIVSAVNDLTVDLDLIGQYIVEGYSSLMYNRVILVAEAATEAMEQKLDSRRSPWG
jgi:hypothetical protein